MTLDNITGITEGSYTGFCKSQLITCNRVKECNGVCPFEDALKHADKEMDEQTVVDHDRDWIIGCLEHDGFIHTHRFDKANQIIHDALSAEAGWIPCSERLPDFGEDVILQFRDNQCVGNRYVDHDEDGWMINSGGNWETPILDGDEEPIAWQPRPKPYKGGDSE